MGLVELILSGADVFLLKDESVRGNGFGAGAGYGTGNGFGNGGGYGDGRGYGTGGGDGDGYGYGYGDGYGSFEAREEYGWVWSS